MYEGIIRIVTVAVICASTSFLLRSLIEACGFNDQTSSEIELGDTLKQWEGHPEDTLSSVWQFETTGNTNTEAA